MKGLFIPGITAEMFRNGCLEGIEALMAEGEMYDIDYTEWIPVSERLPEDTGHEYAEGLTQSELVLAYAVHGDTNGYGIGWYIRDHYTPADSGWSGAFEDIYELSDCEVIAWQPLPEPYKGGDTE